MNIILIGMPGSGKSTLGRPLAVALNYTFWDIDEQIVLREKKSIEAIFAQHGENYFRELERTVLVEALASEDLVISTGGGAPCFFDNMDLIKKNGKSIYLKVPQATLLLRLRPSSETSRPMLKGKSESELTLFLETKLIEREVFYNEADIVLEGSDILVDRVLKAINELK